MKPKLKIQGEWRSPPYDERPEVLLFETIFREWPVEDPTEGIHKALDTLPNKRGKDCVMMRFGMLNEGELQAYHVIASKYGVSAKRIWQIVQKQLRLLRHPRRTKYLHPYKKGK